MHINSLRLTEKDDYQSAREKFKRVLQLDPNDADALKGLGNIKRKEDEGWYFSFSSFIIYLPNRVHLINFQCKWLRLSQPRNVAV